jgi:Gpi18-like mannosyltransferase
MKQIVSLAWSCLIFVGFLWWAVKGKTIQVKSRQIAILLILTISLLLRIIPAFFLETGTNYDIESYKLVSENVIGGDDVYTESDTINRHPYLPFQLYWLGLAGVLAKQTAFSFNSIVRLLPILADGMIAIMLFFILKDKKGQSSAFHSSILYALNPVSVFVAAYHGQFDAIPLLFILLSVYWLFRNQHIASVFLGFGILNKSWPVLFFPILWKNVHGFWRKIFNALLAAIPPIAGIFLYAWVFEARILTVLKRAVTYNHGIGAWGYTYLLRMLGSGIKPLAPFINSYFFHYARFATLLVLGIIWLFFAQKKPPIKGFLIILLSFYSFSHAFAIQYLVWILPFAILCGQKKWLRRYTIAAFGYMILIYNTIINHPIIPTLTSFPEKMTNLTVLVSIPIWIIAILWLVDILRCKNNRPDLFSKDRTKAAQNPANDIQSMQGELS